MARRPDTAERLLADAKHVLESLDPCDAHARWLPDYIDRTWGPMRDALLERIETFDARAAVNRAARLATAPQAQS